MLRPKNAALVAALSLLVLTSCRAPEPRPTERLPVFAPIPAAHAETGTVVSAEKAVANAEGTPGVGGTPLDPVPAAAPADSVRSAGLEAGVATSIAQDQPRYLTWGELDAAAAAAGWEIGPWLMMRNIVFCETGGTLYTHAHNATDANGGSHGLAQMNGRYPFDMAGLDFEQRYDPVVNLRAARWLWEARGRLFGGTGGWYWCSLKLGYH